MRRLVDGCTSTVRSAPATTFCGGTRSAVCATSTFTPVSGGTTLRTPLTAHSRRIAYSVIGAAALAASGMAMAGPAGATSTASTHATWSHSCATPHAGMMACNALKVTNTHEVAPMGVHPNLVPSGYGPSDLLSAYKLPANGGAGMTIAIVDAQDDPNAASDMATYRAQYGLPGLRHRLLHQDQPERQHHLVPGPGRGLGRGDVARPRHGVGHRAERPHPAGRGHHRDHGQPGHRGQHRRRPRRQVRLQQLRRRRELVRHQLRLAVLQPPGRRDHRLLR